MPKRLRKVPQPPIDLARRRTESRSLGWGAVIVAAGVAMLCAALLTRHPVANDPGETIPEWRLVELVTRGGAKRIAPEDSSSTTGPAQTGTIQKVENPPDLCPT
ncbi:MAG TPA: hypothetical protein VMZ50_00100 [Phycisphaerae bacterium]|nr:hypothetical protein [Phycisphaerae bacterium]